MPTICKCTNCGDMSSMKSGDAMSIKCPMYCSHCSTEEKREKMKVENERISAELNKRYVKNSA